MTGAFIDLLGPMAGSFAIHVFLKMGTVCGTPTPTIVRMDMIRREDYAPDGPAVHRGGTRDMWTLLDLADVGGSHTNVAFFIPPQWQWLNCLRG